MITSLHKNVISRLLFQVAAKMLPYAELYFGNPSSGHVYGEPCKKSMEVRTPIHLLIVKVVT